MYPTLLIISLLGADFDTPWLTAPQEIKQPFAFDVLFWSAVTSTKHAPQTALFPLNPEGTLWSTDTLLQPSPAATYPSLALSIAAEYELRSNLEIRTWLDTGELRQGSSLDPPLQGYTSNGAPWDADAPALGQHDS
ncbi:MAG: hypothetical protein R3C68_04895 [Myxococcota bacterium]